MINWNTALPFPGTFFGITTDPDEYLKLMDELETGCIDGWPHAKNTAARCSIYPGNPNYIIVCFNKNSVKSHSIIEILALIIHEATHIKQFIYEQFGEDKAGYEHEAYFMQWICQCLMTDIANGA